MTGEQYYAHIYTKSYNPISGMYESPSDIPFGIFISDGDYQADTPKMEVVKENCQARINPAITTPWGETYRVLLQEKLLDGGAVATYPVKGDYSECKIWLEAFRGA